MLLAAGTKNPAKLSGIRAAFSRYFPSFRLEAVDSSGVARPQPVGLDQIVSGAIARAKHAISLVDADFGIGVEAGIFRVGAVYFDQQQAALTDRGGRVSLGHSAGYTLPSKPMEELIGEEGELEDYAAELSGVPQIGDKGGLVHYLSGGKVTRSDLTDQCVTMALIPWLNRTVYGL